MTHQPEIWDCIQKFMPKGKWISLKEIYGIAEGHLELDSEDYDWQSPSSSIPRWKRNVRNVLQYRKSKGELEWDGNSHYKR